MFFSSWLRDPISSLSRDHRNQGTGRTSAGFRPRFEVLEGRDLPSFAATVTYAEPASHALVMADVNGDGKPDLITLVDSGFTYVSVRLNKGNGKFGPEQASYDHLQADTTLAVGDVNGDGKPDIVLGHAPYDGGPVSEGTLTGGISVLVGDGTGHFTFAGTYNLLPNDITSLVLADVNGDGRLDVVGAAGGAVFTALNAGGGMYAAQSCLTYSDPTAQAAGGTSLQVAVGDVTGDGKPDIVAAGYGAVCVYPNLGGGGSWGTSFGTAQTYAVGGSATSVALGDFNGDGKLDVVTANSNGTASVLLNSGNGTFGVAQTYAVGGAATSVVVGDFNGDGKLDIATTGAEMDLLLNKGTGTFAAYQNIGPAGNNLVAGDFDGDGFLDLAQIDASGNDVDVLHNKANWSK